MNWSIYLSGEIHTDWRQQIEDSCRSSNLPVTFSLPVTDHDASDEAGDVLGAEESRFWRDHKSAKVNQLLWPKMLKLKRRRKQPNSRRKPRRSCQSSTNRHLPFIALDRLYDKVGWGLFCAFIRAEVAYNGSLG
jgi:hypothetical protein